jgi:Flp pilus assembly protein TadD/peroxiredoxin
MMPPGNSGSRNLSRRALLKRMGLAPVLLRPSPIFASFKLLEKLGAPRSSEDALSFTDVRYLPHYPSASPLANVLRLVPPGSDEYITEKYATEVEAALRVLAQGLKSPRFDLAGWADYLHPEIEAVQLGRFEDTPVRTGFGIEVVRRQFDRSPVTGKERFLGEIRKWAENVSIVQTAEFEIYGIDLVSESPPTVKLDIRFDLAGRRKDLKNEERVGSWRTEWVQEQTGRWKARRWQSSGETVTTLEGPAFVDRTQKALGSCASYTRQLLRGVDEWRTALDGAIGIDIYSNNGVAAGDFDNDGFDDLYVCQPAGLPNRLYRNRGDGTFEDVTEKAGVGVLDNTACALFADFDNKGRQDLLVVCGTGPLLFQNQGDGTFRLKHDAFRFARPPQGTFTHAALADYDRDGRLDIYFCTYMYYLGLDQYHYPIPYYDARNGPPNCLLHNEGNGTFVERTEQTGLNADNDRYSFACAWGDSNNNGLPDLFVVNDFGSSQLYRNNGDGSFTVVSRQAGVEEVGAGMSCCWADYDNDGHQDVYVPSMWEAAGQRVSGQPRFHQEAPAKIRELYQRHARGNALYRNHGDGTFNNVGHAAAVEMGRWSWCSDFFDFDHDGFSDLYVSNGYISAPNREDLAGFFWRQVVAKSPDNATPSVAYERGWSAINELIRADNTWHGYARNVMFANNQDGTFSEISAPSGLDFREDSRSFALADIDHDGKLEIILKNRNAPQLRILHNEMKNLGGSISFRLRGQKSNRDAIGTSITLQAGSLKQTKYLQAGTGFLAQHAKELHFGVGKQIEAVGALVRWPSGLVQQFEGLPIGNRIQLEEGSEKFSATPFAAATLRDDSSSPQPPSEISTQVETWLIEPLAAPDFSLADLAGNQRTLSSLRGSKSLLCFWSLKSPASLEQLKKIEHSGALIAASRLKILAISLDESADQTAARNIVAPLALPFPLLFATEQMAGVYNILYRHLFDRRRDLPIPASLLLDTDGKIIKVYQGPVEAQHVLEDCRIAPATDAERSKLALPFPGLLCRGPFQRNDFTYGVAFFQHGYYDEAAASFEEVIAAQPDNPEAYYNLGTLNLRRNQFAEAQKNLEQTLKLRPDYPEAWNNLGMMAAQQGQAAQAIEFFQRSLRLRPAYAIAMLNLGNVYRRQGDFAQASESLQRALEIQPDDPEILYSLGMLSAQQRQTDKAADYLNKAIALRPDYPEALNNLGVLYVRGQDYARAEEQFRACIRLVPQFDQSYLNLARLDVLRGDKAGAQKILKELLELQPDNKAAQQAMQTFQ